MPAFPVLSSAPPSAAPAPNRSAAAAARANWAANVAAVSKTQPILLSALDAEPTDVRPVYARDHSLTVFGPDGKWWHGCSVPLRAADAMLATLEVKGRVACLLPPTLATHLRTALQRSRPGQAIVALCASLLDLRVLLRCDDFSDAIRSHRLWFAWGDDWAAELKRLFAERPGLATPAQFIRLPTTPPEEVDRTVSAAQAIFAEVNAARVEDIARRRDAWRRPAGARRRVCIITPSRYRLWDDAGAVLAAALQAEGTDTHQVEVASFDTDDPACSSALALVKAIENCHAVVAADTLRCDLPGVAPSTMPWISWITRPWPIPRFDTAGPADGLVLADPAWGQRASAAGWPADRVSIGGWPTAGPGASDHRAAPPVLAVVADTRPIAITAALAEFSSHQILWNHIAAELADGPFAIDDGPPAYLQQRMKRHGVSPDGFDTALFLEGLILPAYEQAIVRMLLRERLPVRLFGHGWTEIDEFRQVAAGPVLTGSEFCRIRRQAAALVDVSPTDARPLHRLGRPVVRPGATGQGRHRFLDAARRALTGGIDPEPIAEPVSLAQFLPLLPA